MLHELVEIINAYKTLWGFWMKCTVELQQIILMILMIKEKIDNSFHML